MNFSGEIHIPAPRQSVFDRLRDAPFFASCVEGVGDLAELAPDQYTARLTTRIAYIRFEFDVTVQLVLFPHVVSSTARTLRASASAVNGFWRKLSPGSSIPWWTIASPPWT